MPLGTLKTLRLRIAVMAGAAFLIAGCSGTGVGDTTLTTTATTTATTDSGQTATTTDMDAQAEEIIATIEANLEMIDSQLAAADIDTELSELWTQVSTNFEDVAATLRQQGETAAAEMPEIDELEQATREFVDRIQNDTQLNEILRSVLSDFESTMTELISQIRDSS
jgi:PBP1b-binding outer membrane lipoprotein LpoB